jgi:hypothetical protein
MVTTTAPITFEFGGGELTVDSFLLLPLATTTTSGVTVTATSAAATVVVTVGRV